MDTGTKVLIGAGVVIGGVLLYRAMSAPNPVKAAARPLQTPPGQSIGGFLNFATSAFNYFTTKQTPTPVITPGVHGTGGSWDATSQNYLPLGPGETAYSDDTSHDSILN